MVTASIQFLWRLHHTDPVHKALPRMHSLGISKNSLLLLDEDFHLQPYQLTNALAYNLMLFQKHIDLQYDWLIKALKAFGEDLSTLSSDLAACTKIKRLPRLYHSPYFLYPNIKRLRITSIPLNCDLPSCLSDIVTAIKYIGGHITIPPGCEVRDLGVITDRCRLDFQRNKWASQIFQQLPEEVTIIIVRKKGRNDTSIESNIKKA